ncbi:unnamed protein product [Rhizophagus irregularis]|nr:unnamed protein product [Rhizophagus irregularis]
MKRGPYKTGKTPKSTYYDKYGPNGTLTKVAASTEKITNFFKISSTQVTNPQLSRADTLELEKQYNQLTVVEYNYKRTIFEYLTLLNNNNRRGRIDISLKVTQKIFIDGGVWKARKILYLTKYWLLNNKLPESRCRKHQKTIRIIDDEDVAERCHIWIRKQDFKATPALFKKFIETELFPSIGITREKSIALITAARCESMDQIHPNLSEGEKERILVVRDECIFYSNDGKRRCHYEKKEMKDQLCSNHAAFSKDALVASQMNLNPGGKQPVMRNTYFGPNN